MKLLEIIDKTQIGKWVSKKQEQIENTDPQKIYVENIRSFFGVSTKVALFMCDSLVKQKKLTKHIGYICPNDTCKKIIFSEAYGNTIRRTDVSCINCEIRGEESYSFDKGRLSTVIFYKMTNNEQE